jgi:hypothetical protein
VFFIKRNLHELTWSWRENRRGCAQGGSSGLRLAELALRLGPFSRSMYSPRRTPCGATLEIPPSAPEPHKKLQLTKLRVRQGKRVIQGNYDYILFGWFKWARTNISNKTQSGSWPGNSGSAGWFRVFCTLIPVIKLYFCEVTVHFYHFNPLRVTFTYIR